MLPLFKKSHIHSRHIEDYVKTGFIRDYTGDANKRNALRQAGQMFRIVDGELFRHGTQREYEKYGLRLVVHDDQPEKKAEIIGRCHIDSQGNHLGMNNTIKNVTDTYYWQGISAHVKMYLKQCEQCKMRSKLSAEEWLQWERQSIDKKKAQSAISSEAMKELKNLGRVKKPTPPETFFIVNAERKLNLDANSVDVSMMIDSNNIEYVVETLGQSDGVDLEEVCHVLNVQEIVPIPERFRSREIETFLKEGTYPDGFTLNMKNGLKGPASQYSIVDGELYHEGNKAGSKGLRLVIHDDLPALKVKVMVECHIDEDGSHCGLNKTISKLNEKYYWMGMSLDVRKFMLHCKICAEMRGKRQIIDKNAYEEEAQEVRSRHLKKMNEAETSDMSLTAVPLNMESAVIQTTDLEEEGHQVIRLIGPNKEVTEITVAVVNQETVTSEVDETEQNINKTTEYIAAGTSSAGHGKPIVTKEMTDAVAQIEAAEAAMELEDQTGVSMKQATKAAHNDIDEGIEPLVLEKQEGLEIVEDTVTENNEEEHAEMTIESEENREGIAGRGDADEAMNVLIIKEGEEMDAKDRANFGEILQAAEKIVEVSSDDYVYSKSGLQSYYKSLIYVPKIKKTRIIENFIRYGQMAPGFTHDRLLEISGSFEIVDDVLYMRPSRYKGRQVVIHDDQPELKLKLIEEHHLKRNGTHCTDLVTVQNVGFKYYWEELKWDVIRWYPTCSVCVKDGVDRRTNKKILSVAERKRAIEERKIGNRVSGLSVHPTKPSRKINRVQLVWDKSKTEKRDLEEFEDAGQADGSGGRVIKLVATPRAGNGDNVEIQMAKKNEESNVQTYALASEEKASDTELGERSTEYDLMVFATLEQETTMKQMFAERDWDYDRALGSKVLMEEESSGEVVDHYLITLKVTDVQEHAIKEVFEALGMDVDDSVSLNKEASDEDQTLTDQPSTSASAQNQVITEAKMMVKEPVKENRELGRKLEKSEPVNKNQEPLVKQREPFHKSPESVVKKLELIKITQQPTVTKQVLVTGQKAEQRLPGSVVPQETKVSTLPKKVIVSVQSPAQHQKSAAPSSQKDLQPKSYIVSSNMPLKEVKTSSVTIVETPKNKPTSQKRALEEDNSLAAPGPSVPTPASESRRSRREIKKPRRFSPDSSPIKSPLIIIKQEPESPEEREDNDSQNEETETERKRKRLPGKDMTSYQVKLRATDAGVKESPVISKAKSISQEAKISESPIIKEISVVRPTRSGKGSLQGESLVGTRSKVETAETETQEVMETNNKKEAKVLVVSRSRIKAKKVEERKEAELAEETMESESMEESMNDVENGINELSKKDKNESKENKEGKVSTREKGNDDDDDDDDGDFDYEDNDDDNNEFDDDEEDDVSDDNEDQLNPALDILYIDGVESMEPVKVEKGYACSLCGAKFPTEKLCVKHGEQNMCYEQCELCGKLFKKKDVDSLKQHKNMHEKNEKFPCSRCEKIFFDKEQLKIHCKGHTGETVAKCGHCKKDFQTWFLFASHMWREHEECNMFTCDVCNAKFVNISFMKSEVLFDGNISFFKCVMCNN